MGAYCIADQKEEKIKGENTADGMLQSICGGRFIVQRERGVGVSDEGGDPCVHHPPELHSVDT